MGKRCKFLTYIQRFNQSLTCESPRVSHLPALDGRPRQGRPVQRETALPAGHPGPIRDPAQAAFESIQAGRMRTLHSLKLLVPVNGLVWVSIRLFEWAPLPFAIEPMAQ